MAAAEPELPGNSSFPQRLAAGRRIWLCAFAVVFIVWVGALMWLALTTANPVVLSRPQIERADFVVTAIRPDPKRDRLLVEQDWRGDLPPGEYDVHGLGTLSAAQMPPKIKFLVPLSRTRDGGLMVTRLQKPDPKELQQDPNKPPLVYEQTPESVRQLQELLRELPRP